MVWILKNLKDGSIKERKDKFRQNGKNLRFYIFHYGKQ